MPGPAGKPEPRQEGAALAYVLGLVAILGVLTALVFRQARMDGALVSREQGMAQARLLARAGVDYVVSRMDPPGAALDLAYATGGVDYALENADLSFHVQAERRALFTFVRSEGRSSRPAPGLGSRAEVRIVQALDLGLLPAVGKLDGKGGLGLLGNASVTGPVLLRAGQVRKVADEAGSAAAARPWRGGAVWDSLSPAWSRVHPDFRGADSWARGRDGILAGSSDSGSGFARDLALGDSARVGSAGTGAESRSGATRLRARRVLEVGRGAVLEGTELLAPTVRILPGAVLRGITAYARILEVTGGDIEGGQFLARDTLRIGMDAPLRGWPVFLALGRGEPGLEGRYRGFLEVGKVRGNGFFLSAALDAPPGDPGLRLRVAGGAELLGLVYSGGMAEVEGRIRGSVLSRGFRLLHRGVVRVDHLREAQVTGTGPMVVPAPLLFPGFPLMTVADTPW